GDGGRLPGTARGPGRHRQCQPRRTRRGGGERPDGSGGVRSRRRHDPVRGFALPRGHSPRGTALMDAREFRRRRKRLMDMMGSESVAIIPTAPARIRNRDVEYPFRGDSDFLYLTGFPEPEAVAVLIPDRASGEFVLFCRERDEKMETWHGRRAGLEGACEIYGADDAFPLSDLDDIVPGLLDDRERVYYSMDDDPA